MTTPAVGRPPAPASVAAAMSSEAFTPYAALGAADNDGLAPGDTYDALHTACMNDAGYGQYASEAVYPIRTNRGMGFPQAYGPWGYVGTALAAEEGFNAPERGARRGGRRPRQSGGPCGNLPAGAQAAAGKCFNILANFNNATFAHSMSIIETLNNYISTDVIQDGEFKAAMPELVGLHGQARVPAPPMRTRSRSRRRSCLGSGRPPGRTPTARPASRPPRRTRRRSRWPWPTRTAR